MMAVPRRRLARVAVVVIPGLALAAPSLPQSVDRAQDLAVVRVVSVEAKYHQRYPGLIVSELQVQTSECLKGSCGQLTSVVVPGGRVGDIEQVVVHEPVPAAGEQVLVSRVNGRLQVLRVDAQTQQHIIVSLRSEGSTGTQKSAAPLGQTIQVPAITP